MVPARAQVELTARQRAADHRPETQREKQEHRERQRFIRRFKGQIRRAVSDAISERSITDIDSGEKINIPARDITEPHFRHGQGGERETVLPGNDSYVTGDRIKRPDSAGGGGGKASRDGEGEDEFSFTLTRESSWSSSRGPRPARSW